MVNNVVISYLSITQLMNADKNMEWQRKMIFISNGILAFGCLYAQYLVHLQKLNLLQRLDPNHFRSTVIINCNIIFQLCHLSENLLVAVGQLEEFITDHLLKSGQSQQSSVCNLLSKFKGFDANGYFTLNHSMLTGMMANIVTYLVILVQFRQSGV